MYCTKCGNEVSVGAKFCAVCGNNVKSDLEIATPTPKACDTTQYARFPKKENNSDCEKLKKRMNLLTAICIAEALIIVIISVFGLNTNSNEAVKANNKFGASSIEELKNTLSSDYLFTEKQVDCMSYGMLSWICEEFDIDVDLNQRKSKLIASEINRKLFEDDLCERMKIEIKSLEKSEWKDIYDEDISDYFDEIESVYGEDVCTMMKDEFNSLEDVYKATYTLRGESGDFETFSSNDYDEEIFGIDLYVYKINERYYWTYIELY